MADIAIWEVTLYVDGPVTVRRRVLTTQQKGFRVDDPFYSDIEIQSVPSGLRATLTARAPDQSIGVNPGVGSRRNTSGTKAIGTGSSTARFASRTVQLQLSEIQLGVRQVRAELGWRPAAASSSVLCRWKCCKT